MTLRAAREHLAWPLASVADQLRIRLCYLEALEADQISLLPGAYILGFLRAYSRALDLDPKEMVRRIKVEAGEITQRTTLTFPASTSNRSIPASAAVLLGLILTVGAYAGWYRLCDERPLPADTVAAIPERLALLAEPAIRPYPATVDVAVDTHLAAPVIVPPVEPAPALPAFAFGSAIAAQAHQLVPGIPPAARPAFVTAPAPLEVHLEPPPGAPDDDSYQSRKPNW